MRSIQQHPDELEDIGVSIVLVNERWCFQSRNLIFVDCWCSLLQHVRGSSKACWYSLKFISKDIPNLPEAMGLTYLSTMYMLECCGLSSKRIDCDEWNFLPKKFQTFINANDLQKVTDVISAKLSMVEADDGKKVRKLFWFIRLGEVDLSKVRFAGYPTNAPRISGIEASRTSFHEALWSLGK